MSREGTYEVRVSGCMPAREVLEALGEVDVAEQEVRTVLSGRFRDQAALYGFLHRLRAFGFEVVEVRRVGAQAEGTPGMDREDRTVEGVRDEVHGG